ncbi:MAG: polymer-forming cytoskeletal protein [Pyrinomonadaceae bacterium]
MFRSSKNENANRGAGETAPQAPGAPQPTSTQQATNLRQTTSTQPTPFAPPPGRAPAQAAGAPGDASQARQAPPPAPSAPTRASTESEALARAVKEGAVGGFVGGPSALAGEVNFRGMMRVDGQLSGRVRSQDGTLIVSSGGRVEAEVQVAVAKINGTVEGDITATERVELGRTARVSGNLQTPALVVEEGAIFEGSCRMTSAAAKPARVKSAA